MKIYELIAPCHFGLEAVLKREITDLGYEISKVEDGKVTFSEMPRPSAMQIFSADGGEDPSEGRNGACRDV